MTRDAAATSSAGARGQRSIRRLRTYILIALIAGTAGFTGVMFTLVQSLSERFGPQVEADLEWRALRGAQELSYKADVGLAISDPAIVRESFGVYADSRDIEAIVAVDSHDKLVAQHGTFPLGPVVFSAPPDVLSYGPGYVASWAPSTIEGTRVGKVAVVVSTRRLGEAEAILSRVSRTTLIAGLAGAILGALVILFFTRAVSVRDQQLGDYAKNLEGKVEARTRELDDRNRGMRLVLDNVAQGFITIDFDGVMAAERSAIVEKWFGEPPAGATLQAMLEPHSPRVARWFALGMESVREGILPLEVCLHQLPRRLELGASILELVYSPIATGDAVERILVIINDITEQIVRERAEREQRELVMMFQRITADRSGFDEFLQEASELVASLSTEGDPTVEKRALHTLKGNTAMYGLESYSSLCHEIESELEDRAGTLDAEQRRRLQDAWRHVVDQVARLVGTAQHDRIEIGRSELASAIALAKRGASSQELAHVLTAWTHEPVHRHFERLGHHATALARRLGKGEIEIDVAAADVRLDGERWSAFWAAMVHAVRNSVDHGFAASDERASAGETALPRLSFVAFREPGLLTIALSDNGRGVDWSAVRERARVLGLPASSQSDLERALFADGVTTRQQASETSGRGLGLSSLRDATTALGGTIVIDSSARGTTFRFQFPEPGPASAGRRAHRPSQVERAV